MRFPWSRKPLDVVPVVPVLIQEAARLQAVQSHLWDRMRDQRATAATARDLAQEIRQNALAIVELLQGAEMRGEQFPQPRSVPATPEETPIPLRRDEEK